MQTVDVRILGIVEYTDALEMMSTLQQRDVDFDVNDNVDFDVDVDIGIAQRQRRHLN